MDGSRAGEFSSCAAAPISIGFEDLAVPLFGQPPPVPYYGLDFSASLVGGLGGFLTVTQTLKLFEPMAPKSLLARYVASPGPGSLTLSIKDSTAASGGVFKCNFGIFGRISYDIVNFRDPSMQINNLVNITGSQNGNINPFCQQTTTSPLSYATLEKVNLGASGGACVADDHDLSFSSQFSGTAAIEIDNFVVCKANLNKLSGLLPTPSG